MSRELETDKTLTKIGREMMELRYCVAGAAVKKLDKMVHMHMPDDTAKGCFSFGGAQQTGRWSAQGLQPMNMKKPRPGLDTDAFFTYLRTRPPLENMVKRYPNYHQYLGCSIRHFIKGPFVTSDYNAIEARIIGWVSGQSDLLQQFRDGVDPYRAMAAKVFGVSPDEIGKPSQERDLGKALVLGAGFGLGGQGFLDQAGHLITFEGQDFLDDTGEARPPEDVRLELAQRYINVWRATNKRIVGFWQECERAALNAVQHPTEKFSARGVTYHYGRVNGRKYLLCRLPSGRYINYLDAKPKRCLTPWGEERLQLVFWAKHPLKVSYEWKSIYGGLLVENIVQAIAADVMINGFVNLGRAGYDIRLLVHDEAVILMPAPTEADCRDIERTMCKAQPWMGDLPLAAEAELIPYYKK